MKRELYSSDWPEISRRVRERAGNRCEQCGVPNGALVLRGDGGEWVEIEDPQDAVHAPFLGTVVKIVLTTAHLDHNPGSVDESRLRSWCQRCHLRYDAPMHARHAAETRRRKKIEARQREML